MKKQTEILLGISGGIDSEYSAKILMNEGYIVHGMYINMLNKSSEEAKKVAENLGINFLVKDKSEEFRNLVVEPFMQCYSVGKTPNPCVECNRFVKIQTLYEESQRAGIPYIATGHYAKIKKINDRYCILKAADLKKDQSYFLWKLTQDQLKVLMFPLGDIIKENVLLNREVGYKESQDVCFISGDYRDFLSAEGVLSQKGNFLSTDGKIIGKHNGIQNYTRGQRKGLGIALGYPAFVTKIDVNSNSIILGTREELNIHSFYVKDLNFQYAEHFEDERVYWVKTRYRATPAKASVKIREKKAYVELFEPDTLVTPGQSAVFYEGDCVAFGGEIIEEGMR